SNNSNTGTTNSAKKAKNIVANNLSAAVKDDHSLRLEADIKRLKADLQASRQCELDLRSQLNAIVVDDKSVKNELSQLRQDNENLQQRLHNLVTAKQHDKQTIQKLEKSIPMSSEWSAEVQMKGHRETVGRHMPRSVCHTYCTHTTKNTENACPSQTLSLVHDIREHQLAVGYHIRSFIDEHRVVNSCVYP
ncbi:unnamed protein product, partial [Oppiella nova]